MKYRFIAAALAAVLLALAAWQRRRAAACGRNRRGWRWRSAPIFASIILDAPQKLAKRKRRERRPLPVAETGSREWLHALAAAVARIRP